MPIIGTQASQISGHLTPPADVSTSYESIATQTLSGSGTLTFTSIPNTFKHLEIRMLLHNDSNFSDNYGDTFYIQFNGDTGSNYSYSQMQGYGTNKSSQAASSTFVPAGLGSRRETGGQQTNIAGVSIFRAYNYKNTTIHKTTESTDALVWRALPVGIMHGKYFGAWRNTAAITSITIYNEDYVLYTGSTAALYGIKG